MSNEWLNASNLEQTHEIISAVNKLSIYTKLRKSKKEFLDDIEEVARARELVISFLQKMSVILVEREAEMSLGTTPRIGELASLYKLRAERLTNQNSIYSTSIQTLINVTQDDNPNDDQILINYLKELRELIEQQSYSDLIGFLGDI